MILIVNLCRHKLHSNEFVEPICQIVANLGYKFDVISIRKVNRDIAMRYKGIIICGTALKDNWYVKSYKKFDFIKSCKVRILGICAGMHIIALVFNSKLFKRSEIGVTDIRVIRDDYVLRIKKGKMNVYELHSFSVQPSNHFIEIARSKKCIQIIKHKDMNIYGVLFHPEVLNRTIVENFAKSCFETNWICGMK